MYVPHPGHPWLYPSICVCTTGTCKTGTHFINDDLFLVRSRGQVITYRMYWNWLSATLCSRYPLIMIYWSIIMMAWVPLRHDATDLRKWYVTCSSLPFPLLAVMSFMHWQPGQYIVASEATIWYVSLMHWQPGRVSIASMIISIWNRHWLLPCMMRPVSAQDST